MIVVLDTNVLVSGIFFHGPPATILEAWFESRFEVYATPKILEEYLRVLEEVSTLKSRRFEHNWDEILVEKCRLIPDTELGGVLPRDPSDAKFLDCAIRSGAHYLVSGDLDLRSFQGDLGFKVVSPRQFLQLL
ncbi:MAG: putative toxin-antitoxin system toxin component, PIN family [Candidatus Omnitrophica bacterium]|nr:putative toxin-antitoxin system toxin component, PIN family [Candidatus Omnitrophota bacterium]